MINMVDNRQLVTLIRVLHLKVREEVKLMLLHHLIPYRDELGIFLQINKKHRLRKYFSDHHKIPHLQELVVCNQSIHLFLIKNFNYYYCYQSE